MVMLVYRRVAAKLDLLLALAKATRAEELEQRLLQLDEASGVLGRSRPQQIESEIPTKMIIREMHSEKF